MRRCYFGHFSTIVLNQGIRGTLERSTGSKISKQAYQSEPKNGKTADDSTADPEVEHEDKQNESRTNNRVPEIFSK